MFFFLCTLLSTTSLVPRMWHSTIYAQHLPCGLRSLLGLGLSFCPKPTRARLPRTSLPRFQRDTYTKMLFAGSSPLPQDSGLCWRSDWSPDPSEIPIEFRVRVTSFSRSLKNTFRSKKTFSNLSPTTQLATLTWLPNQSDFVIFPCDKNLGPAIMEQERYIKLALTDHRSDRSEGEALMRTKFLDKEGNAMASCDAVAKCQDVQENKKRASCTHDSTANISVIYLRRSCITFPPFLQMRFQFRTCFFTVRPYWD